MNTLRLETNPPDSGAIYYLVFFDSSSEGAWNGSEFVEYTTDRGTFDVPMQEINDTAVYIAVIPSLPAGNIYWSYYKQASETGPSHDEDVRVKVGEGHWNGTSLVDESVVQTVEVAFPTSDATQEVSCEIYLPESSVPTKDGCPVVTKNRHIPVPKGLCGTALWTMRLANGLAANFVNCIDGSTTSLSVSLSTSESIVSGIDSIVVRFQDCNRCQPVAEVEAEIYNAELGQIQFQIPDEVCSKSGIYQFQAALMRDGSPFFIDSGGLISVEPSMWGDTSSSSGPPTIQEIRYAIMDRPEENTLLRAVEFDDSDILEAIRWPVRQFNELSPDLGAKFNCNNFPFKYHWVQAVIGRLLLAAVNHYMRNKMLASSGGLNVDDKNRDTDYLRLSKMYQDEWMEWAQLKKIELNASLAWGDCGSRYGGYTGYSW